MSHILEAHVHIIALHAIATVRGYHPGGAFRRYTARLRHEARCRDLEDIHAEVEAERQKLLAAVEV